jgi:hypothetical protein
MIESLRDEVRGLLNVGALEFDLGFKKVAARRVP